MTEHDYRRLARIIGTEVADPGMLLRRHHLLFMDNPLQLLQRVNGRRWYENKRSACSNYLLFCTST